MGAWIQLFLQSFLAVLRYGLALLFLFSSINKILDNRYFYAVVQSYRLLPKFATRPVSFLLPWVELILGILLIAGWNAKLVGWATAILYGLFTAALCINLFRGRSNLDCGCFGARKKHKITIRLVIRDLSLLAAACLVAILGGGSFAVDNLTQETHLLIMAVLQQFFLPIILILIGIVVSYKLFVQTLRLAYLSTKEE